MYTRTNMHARTHACMHENRHAYMQHQGLFRSAFTLASMVHCSHNTSEQINRDNKTRKTHTHMQMKSVSISFDHIRTHLLSLSMSISKPRARTHTHYYGEQPEHSCTIQSRANFLYFISFGMACNSIVLPFSFDSLISCKTQLTASVEVSSSVFLSCDLCTLI